MPNADLLHSIVQPVNDRLSALLAAYQWHPKLVGASVGLVQVGETALLVAALCATCAALEAATSSGGEVRRDEWRAADALFAAAAMVALALFVWSVRIPGGDITGLFERWDHIAFCAFAGYALSRTSTDVRKWTLTTLSVYFVMHHTGWLAVVV